ncbi:MAG: hypothetical protein A2Z20_06620 [Bdellovibrionales bacterium RBG_16_40_8]|nr:MAG: hypothetical protein A2Z20_06620 [Bdellovibrionales bacterium RBG_16_40_8]
MYVSIILRMWAIIFSVGFTLQAYGAVSKNLQIENALRMPLPNRLEAIEKQGVYARHALRKIAFNESATLENRWRAITTYGRLYAKTDHDVIERALLSREWFMRNAALLTIHYGGRDWAIKWASKLLQDKSLIVRTAAVKSLRKTNASETESLLWNKFYSKENYHAGQSLWIRRHILEALTQFSRPGQEKVFIRVLSDKDKTLHSIALQALNKITKEKYKTSAEWENWLAARNKI